MVTLRLCKTAVLCLAILCLAFVASPASAVRIYTPAAGDGYVEYRQNWGDVSWAVVSNSSAITVDNSGDGYRYSTIKKGCIEIPISSLSSWGFSGAQFTLSFFVLSADTYDGVGLYGGRYEEDGVITQDDYNLGNCVGLANLMNTTGWVNIDVTSYIRAQLTSGYSWASFRFQSPAWYNTLSLAAAEDAQGRGSFLEATPVPEPSSLLALVAGISGLGGMIIRRRK